MYSSDVTGEMYLSYVSEEMQSSDITEEMQSSSATELYKINGIYIPYKETPIMNIYFKFNCQIIITVQYDN